MDALERIISLGRVGGHPALDLINTVDWRDRPITQPGAAEELLPDYACLLAWCREGGVLEAAEARRLEALGRSRPEAAEAVAAAARSLREALLRLIRAVQAGQAPPREELAELNQWLQRDPLRLRADQAGFAWTGGPADDLEAPLPRLARLGAELLTSGKLDRVQCCGGPGCGWLFLDTSPNRRRRWCSMEGCGNRAKAKRHYIKEKQINKKKL